MATNKKLKQYIRKVLSEILSSQKIISEGMSVSVKGIEYKRYDTLQNISERINDIIYKLWQSVPQDQQQYFNKNRMGDLSAPDGASDMDSPTGIINLYIAPMVSAFLKKALILAIRDLKSSGIKIGKMKKEKSGVYNSDVIRIPIVQNSNTYDGPPEIHFSNRNAYHIFKNILGFDPTDSGGNGFQISAKELKEKIELILKYDPDWMKHNQIHPNSNPDDNPHNAILKQFSAMGMTIVPGSLDSDGIRQRLSDLLELANWAIKHGSDEEIDAIELNENNDVSAKSEFNAYEAVFEFKE